MTPQAAFERLNRAAGIAPLAMPSFDQCDQVYLPTPFAAATAAASALGLVGAAAAEIWRFRGGDTQQIGVDLAAAAAFLSPDYRLNGMAVHPVLPRAAVTGFYQSADQRWLFLHGGLPHLKLRLLELLNARDERASLIDAVARWNALALEDALGFLGLTGTIVRSEAEWQAMVAGRLVSSPIVLKKIGDAPRAELGVSPAPLGGLKVLDLSRVIAGPVCSRLLAEHGAEVLAIAAERLAPVGDVGRVHGGGKRQALIDLAEPSGAEQLRRLARDADVFVDGFRPGALAGLGFSPEALAHLRPGMIAVSISAYGLEGPWAGRRGWEENAVAVSGLAAEQGAFVAARRGTAVQPERLPGAAVSTLTGVLAAAGAAAALLRRVREGGSWQVQVSLAATANWLSSLGRIDAARVPEGFEPLAGLDQYRQSCETKDGWFEFLGPVVRMSKTPPVAGPLPDGIVSPHWASAHGEANAAEIQSA
jgi:crotonobetainyl-CoA:carnitine CoA-transferase CaiB-like acyl-CoA transferase